MTLIYDFRAPYLSQLLRTVDQKRVSCSLPKEQIMTIVVISSKAPFFQSFKANNVLTRLNIKQLSNSQHRRPNSGREFLKKLLRKKNWISLSSTCIASEHYATSPI